MNTVNLRLLQGWEIQNTVDNPRNGQKLKHKYDKTKLFTQKDYNKSFSNT